MGTNSKRNENERTKFTVQFVKFRVKITSKVAGFTPCGFFNFCKPEKSCYTPKIRKPLKNKRLSKIILLQKKSCYTLVTLFVTLDNQLINPQNPYNVTM